MELFFAIDTITRDGMYFAGSKHIVKDVEYAKTLLVLSGVSEVEDTKKASVSVKKEKKNDAI
jgi:hypothetical protein